MNGYCKAEELFFLKIFRPNFECADEAALLKKARGGASDMVVVGCFIIFWEVKICLGGCRRQQGLDGSALPDTQTHAHKIKQNHRSPTR